jgi:hypothetical protein
MDLKRTLAPDCEGTPSFESVQMDGFDIDNSIIKLRFHFWWNSDVDR